MKISWILVVSLRSRNQDVLEEIIIKNALSSILTWKISSYIIFVFRLTHHTS